MTRTRPGNPELLTRDPSTPSNDIRDPGSPRGGRGPGAVARENMLALQRFLISRGYSITATGYADKRTKSAIKDWHGGVGSRNPGAWSKKNPLPVRVDNPPRMAGSGELPTVAGPGSATKTPKPPKATTSRPGAGGASPSRDLGNTGGNVFGVPFGKPLDGTYSDAAAGIQFDPSIRDAVSEQARIRAQGPQNLADINNWYRQVLVSQGKTAERDAAINTAAQDSMGGATSSILSSLGGEANMGAGVVGAAGAESLGTLKALGSAQDQYNQDIQPLLQAEGAGVSTREMASQSQRARDIADKIINLRGQRGQAQVTADMDVRKYNNDLAQQGFQNNLALKQTELSASMAGLDKQAAELKNQLLQQELANNPSKPGQFVPWTKLGLPDRMNLAQSIIKQVIPNGILQGNEEQTFNKLRRAALVLGYNNPQLLAMLRDAASRAAQHTQTLRNR